MNSPIKENKIRELLDQYLEEHYGNQPVLTLIPVDDPHKLKFNLVDETVTLTCDPAGNITEKKRKRPLPKSEVEGQLSLSDVFQSDEATEPETAEIPEEAAEPETTETPAAKESPKRRSSAKKREAFSEGDVVYNVYTGAGYTIIGSKDGIARVRPLGELSTLMLSESDLRRDNEQSG
jgi:hypothetical protein